MPTARELLEEADALMRRNRSLQGDDIPLLTDSVAVPTEAQVLRGRGAASRGGVPLDPPAYAPQQPDSTDFDSIPTLTEAVDDEAEATAAPDDGGEPSDWLVRDAGEPSITGEVPDSVLVVPPPEPAGSADGDMYVDDDAPSSASYSRDAEAVEFDDTAVAEEIELVAPPQDTPEDAFEAELAGHAFAASAPSSAALPSPPSSAVPSSTQPSPSDTDPLADLPDFAEEGMAEEAPTILDPSIEADDEHATREDAVASPAWVTPGAAPAPAPAAPSVPMPAAVPAAAAASEADWEGVAEEIRMQVLQRIDIFTDTGLRDQLSLRLQPIVDRASADLVATINQHVGELLRAYVAEAIEREIEIWRRNH